MAKNTGRSVFKSGDGWTNKSNSASKAASVHPTQADAIAAARSNLTKSGGGELTIMGRDGQIRDKNTIGGGPDPCPPKG